MNYGNQCYRCPVRDKCGVYGKPRKGKVIQLDDSEQLDLWEEEFATGDQNESE